MNTIMPHSPDNFAQYILNTGNARIWIQPETLTSGDPVVELTDDYESNMLLSPAEALSVAAALQAVAVHLMELQPRDITRKTEPGAPSFEETI